MAVTASYNIIPRTRIITTNKIITPSGGNNPIDLGFVEIPNVRGRVRFMIQSEDNGYASQFEVIGGYGEFLQSPTQRWTFVPGTAINGTVTAPFKNRLVMTTPGADAGGRVYVFDFSSNQSFGPKVMQTSVNVIGNFNVVITSEKSLVLRD